MAAQSQSQTQSQRQATSEQMRLAQMIEFGVSETELKSKMQKLKEIAPLCNEERANVALHDNSYDVEAAANALLNSGPAASTVRSHSDHTRTTMHHTTDTIHASMRTSIFIDVLMLA